MAEDSYWTRWEKLPSPKKVKYLKMIAGGFYVLFLLLFVICVFGGTKKARRERTNVVLFVDPSPDALLSIRYLVRQPEIRIGMIIVGADTGSFSSTIAEVSDIESFVKKLSNESLVEKPIPVHSCNTASSLNTYSPPARNSDNWKDVEPKDSRTIDCFSGALNTFLSTQVASFVVLGAFTEVSSFLQQNTQWQTKIKGLAVAGGAFMTSGDAQYFDVPNDVSEIRFFRSPEAAKELLSGRLLAGNPTLLPLDASFPWDSSILDVVVTSAAKNYTAGASNDSKSIVGAALSEYFSLVPEMKNHVFLSLLTSVYVSQIFYRRYVKIAIFPVGVLDGENVTQQGRSVHTQKKQKNTSVVMSADSSILWKIFNDSYAAAP